MPSVKRIFTPNQIVRPVIYYDVIDICNSFKVNPPNGRSFIIGRKSTLTSKAT